MFMQMTNTCFVFPRERADFFEVSICRAQHFQTECEITVCRECADSAGSLRDASPVIRALPGSIRNIHRTRDMQKRRAVGRTRSRSASPAGGARTREARGRRLDKAATGLVVKRTESRSASPDFRPERERLDQFLQLVDVGERDLIRINAERQKGVKGLAIGGFVRICARR